MRQAEFNQMLAEIVTELIDSSKEKRLIPDDMDKITTLIEKVIPGARNVIPIRMLHQLISKFSEQDCQDCFLNLSQQVYRYKNASENTQYAILTALIVWLEEMANKFPQSIIFVSTLAPLLVSPSIEPVLKLAWKSNRIEIIQAQKTCQYFIKTMRLSPKIPATVEIDNIYHFLKQTKATLPNTPEIPLCANFILELLIHPDTTAAVFHYPKLITYLSSEKIKIDVMMKISKLLKEMTLIDLPIYNDTEMMAKSLIIYIYSKRIGLNSKSSNVKNTTYLTLAQSLLRFKNHHDAPRFVNLCVANNYKANSIHELILTSLNKWADSDTITPKEYDDYSEIAASVLEVIKTTKISPYPKLVSFLEKRHQGVFNHFVGLFRNQTTLTNLDVLVSEKCQMLHEKISGIVDHYKIAEIIYNDLHSNYPEIALYLNIDAIYILLAANKIYTDSSTNEHNDPLTCIDISSLVENLIQLNAGLEKSLAPYLVKMLQKKNCRNPEDTAVIAAYYLYKEFIKYSDLPSELAPPCKNKTISVTVFLLLQPNIQSMLKNRTPSLIHFAWQILSNIHINDPAIKKLTLLINIACGVSKTVNFNLLCILQSLSDILHERDPESTIGIKYDNLSACLMGMLQDVLNNNTSINSVYEETRTNFILLAKHFNVNIDHLDNEMALRYLLSLSILSSLILSKVKSSLNLIPFLHLQLLEFAKKKISEQVIFPEHLDKYFSNKTIHHRIIETYMSGFDLTVDQDELNFDLNFLDSAMITFQHMAELDQHFPSVTPYLNRMTNVDDFLLYVLLAKAIQLNAFLESSSFTHDEKQLFASDQLQVWEYIDKVVNASSFQMPQLMKYEYREYDSLEQFKTLIAFMKFDLISHLFSLSVTHSVIQVEATENSIAPILKLLHQYPEHALLPIFNKIYPSVAMTLQQKQIFLMVFLQTSMINKSSNKKIALPWSASHYCDLFSKHVNHLRENLPQGLSNLKILKTNLNLTFEDSRTPVVLDKAKTVTPEKIPNQVVAPYIPPTSANSDAVALLTAIQTIREKEKEDAQKKLDLDLHENCLKQIIDRLKDLAFGGELIVKDGVATLDFSHNQQDDQLHVMLDGLACSIDLHLIESQLFNRLKAIFNNNHRQDKLKLSLDLRRLNDIKLNHQQWQTLNELKSSFLKAIKVSTPLTSHYHAEDEQSDFNLIKDSFISFVMNESLCAAFMQSATLLKNKRAQSGCTLKLLKSALSPIPSSSDEFNEMIQVLQHLQTRINQLFGVNSINITIQPDSIEMHCTPALIEIIKKHKASPQIKMKQLRTEMQSWQPLSPSKPSSDLETLVIFLRLALGRAQNDTLFSAHIRPLKINKGDKGCGFQFNLKGMNVLNFTQESPKRSLNMKTKKMLMKTCDLINQLFGDNQVRVYQEDEYLCIFAKSTFIESIKCGNYHQKLNQLKEQLAEYINYLVMEKMFKPIDKNLSSLRSEFAVSQNGFFSYFYNNKNEETPEFSLQQVSNSC